MNTNSTCWLDWLGIYLCTIEKMSSKMAFISGSWGYVTNYRRKIVGLATENVLGPVRVLVRGTSERLSAIGPSSDTGSEQISLRCTPVWFLLRQSAWWRRICIIWCAVQSVASVVHVKHHWYGHVVKGRWNAAFMTRLSRGNVTGGKPLNTTLQ